MGEARPMFAFAGRLLAVCQRATARDDLEQLRQTQGECAELIAVIQDYSRGRASRARVTAEMADVLVLIAQWSLREGSEAMRRALDHSLDRLESVLRGERG